MTARYFEAPDAYDEPTLWEHDPEWPNLPQPVLHRCNIRRAYREHLWPLIVAAVTAAEEDR